MNNFNEILQKSLTEAENYIQQETIGKTSHIRLTRPDQANAFTFGMYLRLNNLILQAQNNQDIYIVLLSAQGKNFSSGNDLQNFALIDLSDKEFVKYFSEQLGQILKELTYNIMNFTKSLICCCQGAVVGFVFPLLSMFDQILTTKQTYFLAPMIKMEQTLEMFGSYTFPRHFGYMKSYELFILGKRLSAKEALNSRFVSNIFEDKELMINYALTLCKEIETMNQECISKAKQLMKSQVIDKLWKANIEEIQSLKQIWTDPNFAQKLNNYMKVMKIKQKL